MKSDRPGHVESLLKKIEPLWNQTHSLAEGKLLRIALTRELARALHTLHSELLATGDECEAREVIERENYLSDRFEELGLDNPLSALRQVYAKSSAGKGSKPLPAKKTLVARGPIENEKLNRPDRHWEAAMTVEAEKIGWKPWTLECWTDVTEVEEWGRVFSERLWPRGIILFVESTAFEASLWRGKWYLLLNQAIPAPEKAGFDEGSRKPTWKALS